MSAITHFIVENLTSLIEAYGLLAVFVLMTAESALIPIPSEVTMPFAGFMAGRGVLDFWTVVAVGAFANLIGSWLTYWLGYVKGEEWIRVVIKKYGRWLLIKESEFDKAKEWFHEKGQWVSFGSRLLPVVRTFISLPAGIAKMNLPLFSVLTFIGSFIWSAFLAYLGLKMGQNWQAIEPYFRKFQFLIVGLFLAWGIYYVWSHFKKKD
jgi:membrane protein DedA with SNARE-associated domain